MATKKADKLPPKYVTNHVTPTGQPQLMSCISWAGSTS